MTYNFMTSDKVGESTHKFEPLLRIDSFVKFL